MVRSTGVFPVQSRLAVLGLVAAAVTLFSHLTSAAMVFTDRAA